MSPKLIYELEGPEQEKIYRLLGLATRAGKITAGLDASLGALAKGELCLLLVAKDIGKSSQKKIERALEEHACPVIAGLDRALLAKASGALKRSIVGIKDEGFSAGMLKTAKERAKRPM